MEGIDEPIRRARQRLSVRTMNSGSPHDDDVLDEPADAATKK
jgi:hypothetical protein